MTEIVSENIIEIHDLKKIFEDVKAVDGISINIKKGELFSLLGPNGAGKTTLVRMLTTTLTPTSGEAKIKDFSLKKDKKDIVKFIGICPQENVIYDKLTAEENVIFIAQLHGISLIEAKKKCSILLEKLGIAGKKRWAKKFSGGMKRRLNLAMSIIHEPQIIFLDEPSAGLDPQARRLVWDFIKAMKAQGKTIILMTHDMVEAEALSDHVAIIDQGKVIAFGTPKELKDQYGGDNILEIKINNQNQMEQIQQEMKDLPFILETKIIEEQTLNIAFTGGMENYLKLLQEISSKLNDIEDMRVRQNSLEDVFLNLTGRRLRD